MGLSDASDSRLVDLSRWVFEDLGFAGGEIAPASADASFRRYFRLTRGGDTYIVMDAPPGKEDLGPFVGVARLLLEMGVNAPVVLAQDTAHGYLLLSDLGQRQYLDELPAAGAADRLYADALSALRVMQTSDLPKARELPHYGRELLMREMELLQPWFLEKHLGLQLSDAERQMLHELFAALADAALSQPAAFVHRDFHSRNLLLTSTDNPGILDFQDAVWGPVTYDLVSLLKDCYITWPAQRVRDWALGYRDKLSSRQRVLGESPAEFIRWFALMGLQRHIKVLGIFARLYYRDGKPQYLKDLPRVLDYTREAAAHYPQTAAFAQFIAKRIEAPFAAAQLRPLP